MTRQSSNENIGDERFFEIVVENSRVGKAVSSVTSKGNGVAETLTNVVKESYIYRWLTAEPEPEVIVIDLRETYTVGPFIRLVDAGIDRLAPYWETSTVKRLLDRAISVGDRFAETKVGQLLLAFLTPPEPPEETRARESTEGDERNGGQ